MSENIFQNKLNAYFNNTNSKELDGLSYSSDSMFLNSRNTKNKLILAKDNFQAERIYKELKLLSQDRGDDEIIYIPGTEEMPYDMVDSDKFLSSSKNYNLIKYLNSKKENITVITTIKNCRKKIIPKNILENKVIVLNKGSKININQIKIIIRELI